MIIIGVIAAVILALGLVPPYFEIYKRNGRVVGISMTRSMGNPLVLHLTSFRFHFPDGRLFRGILLSNGIGYELSFGLFERWR